jgi:hypothetical protein
VPLGERTSSACKTDATPVQSRVGNRASTTLLRLRMFEKEAQHFRTRVRTGGVRVAASRIAARPRVRCTMNGPQLRIDTVAGNQPRDGTGTSTRVAPAPFAASVRSGVEAVQDPSGICYVNRGISVAMKDDHGPLRRVGIALRAPCRPRLFAAFHSRERRR